MGIVPSGICTKAKSIIRIIFQLQVEKKINYFQGKREHILAF